MGNVVANNAKGRVAELYRRVDVGDPANARLYVSVFSGSVSDDACRGCDTVSNLVTAGLTELTTNGWTLKTLTSSDTGVYDANIDDTNDWLDIDIGDITWTSVTSGTSTRLVFSYAPDTPPATQAQRIVLTVHDFACTPDGTNVVAQISSEGFYRAQ